MTMRGRPHRPAGRLRHLMRGDRGAVSAEVVLTAPVAMLLILLIAQAALWWHATHIATSAATQALTAARVDGGTSAAGHAHATAILDQLGHSVLHHPQVTIHRDAGTVHVTITGTAVPVVPFLSLPVRADAHGPVERFTPDVLGLPDNRTGHHPQVGTG